MLPWIVATAVLCVIGLTGLGGFLPVASFGGGIVMLLAAIAATALVCALDGYATE